MLNFRPLMSSSSGCAYLLASDKGLNPLLIDCGMRFPQLQVATGFQAVRLAGCLVSHYHGDHAVGIADLLLKAGTSVYASSGTWRHYAKGAWADHYRAHSVSDRVPFIVEGWNCMGFEVVHDAEETFGFLIGDGEENLLYLTDTAYSPHRFENIHIMAVEANFGEQFIRESTRSGAIGSDRFRRTASNHMSIERLERMLDKNDLSCVREIHLLHLSDANSSAAEFKERIQRKTGIPTFVAAKQATSQGGVN